MMPEHAITVIGHTFNPEHQKVQREIDKNVEDPEYKKAILYSHNWVDGFIIHDDREGPYRILPVDKEARKGIIDRGLGEFLPDGKVYKTGEDIEGIIVPLPDKIYLLGNHVDKRVKSLLNDEKITLKRVATAAKNGCKYANEFLTCLTPDKKNPIVTRTYFLLAEQYKRGIMRQSEENGLHEDVKKIYMNMKMPRFIWVVELTTRERFSMKTEKERTILGEIILDTTASKYDILSFLSIHFPGVIIEQDYEDGVLKDPIYIPNDEPYKHISRQYTEKLIC